MKKAVLAALGVGLVLAGVILLSVDWEARAIEKRLSKLVKLVEKRGTESTLLCAGKARKAVMQLSGDVEIRMSDLSRRIRDRGELQAALISLRSQASRISIGVSDRDLRIDRDAGTAEYDFRARIRVETESGTEVGEDVIRTHWRKADGQWQIDVVTMDSEGIFAGYQQ